MSWRKAAGLCSNMDTPEDNKAYLRVDYWDERYTNEEHYDWLLTYSSLSPVLSPFLQPAHDILMLGAGNSSLSSDMYLAGFPHITNIDISSVVITHMRQKHLHMPSMQCNPHPGLQMNMLDLQFPAHSFDIVIDKATMDVLQVDTEDPWNPQSSVLERCRAYCDQVCKVLKPGGVLLQVSFQQPHFRKPLLMEWGLNWTYEVRTLEGGVLPYYLFILRTN